MILLRSIMGHQRELLVSIIYIIANLMAPFVAFALLPILTRYLSTEELGGVFIFQAIFLVLVNIVAAGSMSVLQGYYFRAKEKFSLYLVSSIALSIIIWFVINLCGYWYAESLSTALGLPVLIVNLAIFSSIGAALQAVLVSILQIRERPKQYLAVLASVHFFSFLSTLFFILFVSQTSLSRVIGIVIGAFLGACIAWFYFYNEFTSRPKLKTMHELLKLGLPVIFHSSAMLLIAQTDKFLISSMMSLSDVGSYGVSAQLASLIQILASGMAMAYAPHLYKKLALANQDDGGNSANILKFFIIFLFLFLVIYIIFIHYFNQLIFGSTFIFKESPFVILSVGSAIFGTYFFFSGYFYYYQNTKLLALITCAVALVNLIVSYTLIPKFGLEGAAFGSLIAYMLALICVRFATFYLVKNGNLT